MTGYIRGSPRGDMRDDYCSSCGTRHTDTTYPRTCPGCKLSVWANPIPVAVAIQPVRGADGRRGLLVCRRGIEPRKGFLALIGGFVEEQESWQAGCAREVREEVGVEIDPAAIAPFWFCSTEPRPNRVLLFGRCAELAMGSLPPFAATAETQARGVIWGPEGLTEVFAFPLHRMAAERWFVEAGITGPHGYEDV